MKDQGHLIYITFNKFLHTRGGYTLRELIEKSAPITHIIDFEDSHIFNALILPVIFILTKDLSGRKITYTYLKKEVDPATECHSMEDLTQLLSSSDLFPAQHWQINEINSISIFRSICDPPPNSKTGWLFPNPIYEPILEEIAAKSPETLGSISKKIIVGIKTTANYAFIDCITDDLLNSPLIAQERSKIQQKYGCDLFYPLIRGIEIRDFGITPTQPASWIFYPQYQNEQGTLHAFPAEDIPEMLDFLRQQGFEQTLQRREYIIRSHREWFEIWNPKSSRDMLLPLKIVVPDISPKNNFAIDRSGRFVDGSAYFILLKDSREENYQFVLGILNSFVMEFFYKLRSPNVLYANQYRYWSPLLKQIPLPFY